MIDKKNVEKLEKDALEIRLKLLKLCTKCSIHIGGDLSVADLMTVIWQYAMKYDCDNPKDENRDRFILSKGHASAVTSFCQAMRGCYTYDEIYNEYATDNGRFGMHSCNLLNPYVDVSTGSLGHGLPVATGIAKALKLKGNDTSRVFVVMGDGEMNEGSMYEAMAVAVKYKLGNIVGFVDNNGVQFDGTVKEITGNSNLAEKYKLWGFNTYEVDGHDMGALISAVDKLPNPNGDVPTVIIANTVKGKGVPFMENAVGWHAGTLSIETYNELEELLTSEYNKKWGDK